MYVWCLLYFSSGRCHAKSPPLRSPPTKAYVCCILAMADASQTPTCVFEYKAYVYVSCLLYCSRGRCHTNCPPLRPLHVSLNAELMPYHYVCCIVAVTDAIQAVHFSDACKRSIDSAIYMCYVFCIIAVADAIQTVHLSDSHPCVWVRSWLRLPTHQWRLWPCLPRWLRNQLCHLRGWYLWV